MELLLFACFALSAFYALVHFNFEEAEAFSAGHKEHGLQCSHQCDRGRDAGAALLDDMGLEASGCTVYLVLILEVPLPPHNKLWLGLPFHMGRKQDRTHLVISTFYTKAQ